MNSSDFKTAAVNRADDVENKPEIEKQHRNFSFIQGRDGIVVRNRLKTVSKFNELEEDKKNLYKSKKAIDEFEPKKESDGISKIQLDDKPVFSAFKISDSLDFAFVKDLDPKCKPMYREGRPRKDRSKSGTSEKFNDKAEDPDGERKPIPESRAYITSSSRQSTPKHQVQTKTNSWFSFLEDKETQPKAALRSRHQYEKNKRNFMTGSISDMSECGSTDSGFSQNSPCAESSYSPTMSINSTDSEISENHFPVDKTETSSSDSEDSEDSEDSDVKNNFRQHDDREYLKMLRRLRKGKGLPHSFTQPSKPKSLYRGKCFRIIVTGAVGSGKSSFANTLLGRKYFETGISGSSVTQVCERETSSIHEGSIAVVDTVGYTSKSFKKSELLEAFDKISPGPHAVLNVISLSERFTPELFSTLKQFVNLVGRRVYTYIVIVLTHEDYLETENQTITEFIESSPKEFKELLKRCGNRYITVNNQASNHAKRKKVNRLMEMIDKIRETRHCFETYDRFSF